MTNLCSRTLLVLLGAILAGGCTTRPAESSTTGSPDAAADVEEGRVDAALLAIAPSGFRVPGNLDTVSLAGANGHMPFSNERTELLDHARRAGEALWKRATSAAQSTESVLDDRPLYWQRLQEKRKFRKQCGEAMLCAEALAKFERASRGATDIKFSGASDLRILVSGFDPFGLDKHIDQSNPSGAAVLALDGQRLVANGTSAELQAVVFPVRFADFDEGMVEAFFEPFVTGSANHPRVDMLITVSMGRDDFDLERFPARRRSATAPDNQRVRTGASATNPLLPRLNGTPLAGPEFVEFSLPVAAMREVQSPYRVHDNRNIETLENGRFDATGLEELADQTAVSGSGGGYLSNEISYRAVRLVQIHNADIAVGHIHTPRISAFDAPAIKAISDQLRAILREAIGTTR